MLFPTIDFAVFFILAFTGSWMLRPYPKVWRWFLLGASVVFYLDPFNPVHNEGDGFLTVNPALLLALAGLAAVVWQIDHLAFGDLVADPIDLRERVDGDGSVVVGAAASASAAARVAHRPDGAAAVGRGGAPGHRAGGHGAGPVGPDDLVPSTLRRANHRSGAGAVWAPAVVTVLVVLANLLVSDLHADRPSQNSRWLFLLVGVALVNHTFARGVFAALSPNGGRTATSRLLVRAAIVFDLAVLGWFKYVNWFSEMWVSLAGAFGVQLDWLPGLVLPIAISFFTFQAVSYVVDVGRGELAPVSLLDFTVYLTFFAHVVAGPIVRVKEFVPQLAGRADPRYVATGEAFELIFRGLFKKVVVSSFLASQIVQPVFDAPGGFTRIEVLFAIVGYAVQIYADFSGYTDIAIGIALLLGLRFPQNFDAPYRAVSLQDFWRRWHMTLSRWLRDYLYIPLGGNRLGPSRTQMNLFLTMLLGGLWHGANGTFLVWGALHGGGLAAERKIKERWAERGPLGLPAPVVRTLQWALTFTIVCVAWVFFNARDMGNALAVLGQVVVGEGTVGATSRVTPVLVGVVALSIASHFVPPSVPRRITDWLSSTPPIVQAACGAIALLLVAVLGTEGIAPFIYFQF